ncbi:MAG: 2-phosphosulfolactate phosphatase [Bacteroidota bacterium]
MKNISVCLSPELIHLFDLKNKIVVIVDILRATSTMTTAFAYGINRIKPMDDVEKCREHKNEGYVISAERGGQMVEGFDYGNSPFSYMNPNLNGSDIAFTTTNGTLAIHKSLEAENILIGSFLNLSAVADKIKELNKDVVIHCAGWKGSVNTEDTLFAGALIEAVKNSLEYNSDDAILAHNLFLQHQSDLLGLVLQSAHAKRLQKFGIKKDIEFCLKIDEYDVVPYLEGDHLVI